jgi:serine phosphatase RsbU (regulator of sigma subunit)/anti-anti-sigma regulatory factor
MTESKPLAADVGNLSPVPLADDCPEPRILVIDDDPMICRVLALALQKSGYAAVETARDAEYARAILRRGGIGVVITDIRMPGTDGLTLMQWALANCPGPAWIVLSGQATFADAVKAVKLGAFDFISKPIVEMESFLVAVRNALRQRKLVAEQARLQSELEHRNSELRRRVGQLEEAFGLLTEQADTIAQDLVRAELVQRALLPQRVPELGAYTFDAYYRPSHKVGGDIYDVVRVDDDHAAFYVADAAGHGVSAAMVAVLFKLRLRLYDAHTDRVLPPDQTLAEVNRAIRRECAAPGLFLTTVLCQLNLRTGELLVASGGHPPLLLRRATGETEVIGRTGPALGLEDDARYTTVATRLNPGDRLLLYTDGITDPGASGRPLNSAAVLALLGEPCEDRQHLLLRIRELAVGQDGAAEQEDDVTLVLVTAGATGGVLDHESAPAPGTHTLSGHGGHIVAGSAGGSTFFSFQGRCGWTLATAFHDACRDQMAAAHGIVLDFAACTFLDSTLLGTIYEMSGHADQAKSAFALQGLPREIRALFAELAMENVLRRISALPQTLPATMNLLMLLPTSAQQQRQRIIEAHNAIAAINEFNREKFLDVISELRRGTGSPH